MISKKLFVEALNNIRKQEDRIGKIENALEEIMMSSPILDVDNLYLKSLLDILKYEFKDKEDYIDWWLWEDVEKIIYVDDKTIDVTAPEDLYDFLMENMNDNN